MKVLHVIPSVSPLRGGPSYVIRDMCRELSHQGVTVHLATTDDNGRGRLAVPLGQPVTEDGATTWYFPRQTHFYTFSWPLTRWLASHVSDYDFVHIHSLFSYATLPASLFAYRFGIPYAVRPLGTLRRWGFHNRRPYLKRLSFAVIEQRILRKAAFVHFTTQLEQQDAQALGVLEGGVVIPHGVDLRESHNLPPVDQLLQRYPELCGRRMLLFLSRLDPVKGLDLLLPAFAQVQQARPDTVLILAGEGEPAFVANLQAEVAQLGLSDAVVCTGFLRGPDKLAALASADVFVLPSYSESFGLAAVEAMACWLPVIVSDQVGIYPDIQASGAGLVVPCTVDALAAAMERLLSDTERAKEMGMNGRRLVEERYSLEVMARQLVFCYEQAIVARRRKVAR